MKKPNETTRNRGARWIAASVGPIALLLNAAAYTVFVFATRPLRFSLKAHRIVSRGVGYGTAPTFLRPRALGPLKRNLSISAAPDESGVRQTLLEAIRSVGFNADLRPYVLTNWTRLLADFERTGLAPGQVVSVEVVAPCRKSDIVGGQHRCATFLFGFGLLHFGMYVGGEVFASVTGPVVRSSQPVLQTEAMSAFVGGSPALVYDAVEEKRQLMDPETLTRMEVRINRAFAALDDQGLMSTTYDFWGLSGPNCETFAMHLATGSEARGVWPRLNAHAVFVGVLVNLWIYVLTRSAATRLVRYCCATCTTHYPIQSEATSAARAISRGS